jgi:uncharacterized membrane protein YgdD (TMEM256/DUF423 family)
MAWIRIAAIAGFLAVAFGAFGAHALRARVSAELLSVWNTGVLYHLVHAVALLALALYGRATSVDAKLPAALFTAGIVLFSGSLYALVLTGERRLGMITPIGGLALLAGWVAVFVTIGRPR